MNASTMRRASPNDGKEGRYVRAGEALPMGETQGTISRWATDTFGEPSSNARVAARANEEMAELLRDVTSDQPDDKVLAEIADVVIVLYRLAERLGGNLHAEVDAKMAINRRRQWKKTGDGNGYHERDKST